MESKSLIITKPKEPCVEWDVTVYKVLRLDEENGKLILQKIEDK